jgi:hypothetical protein
MKKLAGNTLLRNVGRIASPFALIVVIQVKYMLLKAVRNTNVDHLNAIKSLA